MTYTESVLQAERLAFLTGENKGDWIAWLPQATREELEDDS